MSILVRYTAITLTFMLGATSAYAMPPPDCPPMIGKSALKLSVDEYHLSLNNKKPICVALGGTVKIWIHNPPSSSHIVKPDEVTAGQKANSPFEITGVNSGNGKHLVLTVKEFASGAGSDTECGDGTDDCAKFWIHVDGVGTLDPRVRVVEGGVQRLHDQNNLQLELDSLDVTETNAEQIFVEQDEREE